MSPKLNGGDYVFCTVSTLDNIGPKEVIGHSSLEAVGLTAAFATALGN